MNSKSMTFPRNEESETFWPVKPDGPTTGNVKSGAVPELVVVEAGDVVVDVTAGVGCENE